MSETLTDTELAEWYDTAMSTATALCWSPATPDGTLLNGSSPAHAESFDVTIDTGVWLVRITVSRMHVSITRKLSTTPSTFAPLIVVSELTRRRLGELICEAVWGERYVPVASRRMMRGIVRNASRDADYYLRLARERWAGIPDTILRSDDDADAWDQIIQAASSEAGHPLGFMWSYRKADVPMYAFDVYDDAFIGAASNLLEQLRKGRS